MGKPISVWMSEEELAEIEAQRKKDRRTRSDWIKQKIFPYGNKITTK